MSELVCDQASVVVLVTDRDGTIRETSRYATELLGPGVCGSRLADWLIDFESSFDLRRAVSSGDPMTLSVATSQGFPQTLRFHFSDCGEELLVMAEPLHQEIDSLHDSLFALNAEISNLNRDLHKKTAELERLNEVKNRFIGMAAHDLRNPIGGIHELAAVLHEEAERKGDESHTEVFSAVRESTGFMLGLIEDMLTAITIESGEMRLNLELTDLNELISSTLRLNRVLADKKGMRLDLQQESVPRVMVDRLKLRQV
ncbi:MAG: sensor histidine kinase, partial [Spirochaetota bacterium]